MGMNYVERGENSTKYFTDEDNDRIVSILKGWIPLRKKALAQGTPLPMIPNIVALEVTRIITNISLRFNYRDYPFLDDMVADSIANILRYLHTFDVEHIGKKGKINFFSWVTMCTDRSFSKKISDEEKETYIRLRSFEEVGGFAAVVDDPDFQAQEFQDVSGITMDFRERINRYEVKRDAVRIKDRSKTEEAKNQKKDSKIPKGFRMLLGKNNPPEQQDDFGDTEFEIEGEEE